jgi:hypothetical protein
VILCRDLGVHNNLYPAYRMLCWITHPTTHGAPRYLVGDRKSTPMLMPSGVVSRAGSTSRMPKSGFQETRPCERSRPRRSPRGSCRPPGPADRGD